MSTVDTGRAAEQLAAEYMGAAGFTILDRNWRNRWCEIDIVVRRGGHIRFVEVKYRRDVRYGFAAEYITYEKSARLIRAALAWNQAHRYDGPYQIDVVTVEGAANTVAHLENVISA